MRCTCHWCLPVLPAECPWRIPDFRFHWNKDITSQATNFQVMHHNGACWDSWRIMFVGLHRRCMGIR